MTVYNDVKIGIQVTTQVGSGSVLLQTDSGGVNTLAVSPGVDFAVRQGVGSSIPAFVVFYNSIGINPKTGFIIQPKRVQLNAINQDYAPDDTLTLSRDDFGNWSVTLSNYYWSDLGQGGIFKGFRIVCGDFGEAVIAEDPQFHTQTVPIDMITPFQYWSNGPGTWHLYIPEGTDFNSRTYTPNYFRDSALLNTFMKDTQKFVVSESQYLSSRIRDLRQWHRMPPDFLGPLIRTLGCLLRLDFLDDEARRRLAVEWIRFTQYAGTQYFIDFLGYIYDTHFDCVALWTSDYYNFTEYDEIDRQSALSKGLPYYPTNHVGLRYNPQKWTLDDATTRLIVKTFYQLASVPLVLQSLLFKRLSRCDLYIVMVDHQQRHVMQWSPFVLLPGDTLPTYIHGSTIYWDAASGSWQGVP